MTEQLCLLEAEGKRLVEQAFDGTMTPALPVSEIEEYVVPADAEADVEALEMALHRVIADYEPGDTAIDPAIAPEIHRHLDISRRLAGDERFWHWLAVVRFPEFVWHRHDPAAAGNRTPTSMRQKFVGSTRDLYTHAFSQLWFMMEFTHDGDDYSAGEALVANRYVTNRIFDRADLRRRSTARAFAVLARDDPSGFLADGGAIAEATAKAVSHQLSTVEAEYLSEEDVQALVEEVYEGVLAQKRGGTV